MGFFNLLDYIWVLFGICAVPVLVIWLVVMSKALDQVSQDLRNMSPGAVWLCLIPLFGVVWQFLVVNAVGEGLAKELLARNMFPKEEKPAYGYGLSGCILISCIIVPYAGVCIALIGLVLLVVHTIKISEYNAELKRSGRWETFYQARMNAIREQMNNPYPHYPQAQHPPQQYYQQNSIPAYTPYHQAPEPVYKSKGKDRPENPFG